MRYDDAGKPVSPATYDRDGLCTRNQWGRIRRELERLGLADDHERLRLTSQLARRGGEPITSTRDLTAGEAGRVVRTLAGCATLADAYRVAGGPARRQQFNRIVARLTRQLKERGLITR